MKHPCWKVSIPMTPATKQSFSLIEKECLEDVRTRMTDRVVAEQACFDYAVSNSMLGAEGDNEYQRLGLEIKKAKRLEEIALICLDGAIHARLSYKRVTP